MFVHPSQFAERHRRSPGEELSIDGQEKTGDTAKLAKMNLAVHGLSGEIREGNSYYEDPFEGLGHFDFVMANSPFNVDRIDKAKRRRLIEERLVDVMVAVGPNFFYSVTLPVTLWFAARSRSSRAARTPSSRSGSPTVPTPMSRVSARSPRSRRSVLDNLLSS